MSSDIRQQIDAMSSVASTQISLQIGENATLLTLKESAQWLVSSATQGEYHFGPKVLARALAESAPDRATDYPAYCRELMLQTMHIYYSDIFPSQYSKSLLTIIERESKRVLKTLEASDITYTLDDDAFVKDLMCFTGRLIPCGMYVVDIESGFPRSYLIKPNVWAFLSNLFFFIKAGGFRRYAQVHVHQATISEFSATGRNESFARIAELIEMDTGLLGVMGAAWYYDPIVAEISPHLSYLGQDPDENGARLFNLGETDAAKQGALKKSKTRRTLFAKGQYTPAQYVMIWPKKSLSKWLAKTG